MKPLPDRSLFKVVHARESILCSSLDDDKARGYYPSIFCQLSLPVRRQAGSEYSRDAGNGYHMSIFCPERVGLPYGIYPRGILAFIARSVKVKKRAGVDDPYVVELGPGIGKFIEKLTGTKNPTGGERGNLSILDRQLRSIARSKIEFSHFSDVDTEDSFTNYGFIKSGKEARGPHLWEPERETNSGKLIIRLDEDFYWDLADSAAPFDTRILAALWPNCLKVDIAMWLAYRSNKIQCGTRHLTWTGLREQFGSSYISPGSHRVFKARFREAFDVVRAIYDPSDPDCVRLDSIGDERVVLTVRRPMVPELSQSALDTFAKQERKHKASLPGPHFPKSGRLFG